MTDDDFAYFHLRHQINPCKTPGCISNCAYAWSCHNTRLGKIGFFWPGITLTAALVMMVFLR